MNNPQSGMLLNLVLPMASVFLIFYFIYIVPQRKEQKKFKMMLDALKKNDQIVTAGGVHGTIVNVKEKTFVVRVDDNARIEIDKSAVARIDKQGTP